MPSWNAFSFIFGPLLAFGGLAVLVVVLRWSTATGGSLVQRPVKPGKPTDYGLLVPVAEPKTFADGAALQKKLEQQGLRATLAQTKDGPRILVFAGDEQRARALLR